MDEAERGRRSTVYAENGCGMTWEYKSKRLDAHLEPQELESTLNALGREGWELVTVLLVVGTHALAFLKRPEASDES